ncbi:hypothetical protein E0W68_03075 [Flavobacterium salilacus subsp. salilacus]|uniref:hypothetical protein n=1 Tax=Flavobacterium TaxID=237 RepID=UPI0013C2CF75|nr:MULTISPECIES: hypothetical protein [Flavobacterium]KAF2519346.1 hypothetical protein E0W68_03075 [Flavobacterium salilacus subsp. salilacus]MBE1614764.1 hypothetical protein [Flavobacterium sp. SaA2.13]
MKYLKLAFLYILLMLTSCFNKTSTPKEHLNDISIPKEQYLQDVEFLNRLVLFYSDSLNKKRVPKSQSKIIEVTIDTIFYSSNRKISFLAIKKNSNSYLEQMKSGKDNIQFVGECFIGYKNEINNFNILKKLKYTVTSRNYDDTSEKLRIIYLREMHYIDGKYNLNDRRFWTSSIWDENEGNVSD